MALYGSNKLIEPGRAKRLKVGVGHDGKPRALAKPGEAILDTHHTPAWAARGQEAQQHTRATLGKPAKAKTGYAISVHSAMTDQQKQLNGMGHNIQGAPDASSSNPLAPTAPGKRLSPPMTKPGMRSRTSQHDPLKGEAHLQEAFNNSSPGDAWAHGRSHPLGPIK
jgi:hypothetical protein